MSYYHEPDGQLTLLELDCPEDAATQPRRKAPAKSVSELVAIPYLYLDLSPGHVDLFGNHYWELRSPYREGKPPLNTGPAPRKPIQSSLSEILESDPDAGYYLSARACRGILRRAEDRGKELPPQLKAALMAQAGLGLPTQAFRDIKAYHINQQDEGIAGALMATGNLQMQLFITQPEIERSIAFAANQRDEVRDLHDVAGALSTQPGMKKQTYVAGITAKGNEGRFLSEEQHAALSRGSGMAGQGYPCALVAGFSAGAGASAGSIGYSESVAPTLKGSAGGNCMPSVLCLNDQGGSVMDCSEGVAGTLRAQEHSHQPLVLATQQSGAEIGVGVCPTITAAAGMSGNNQPVLFENHGIDARYTGPHSVSPTLSARAGTGGNNLPLVEQDTPEAICIMGPAIDRHGIGYQETASATAGGSGKNPNSQFAGQNLPATETPLLIRRLTPLECERLQGFPDGWTALPGASASARYKALGNSVAIPCVEFIMRGIVLAAGR